jgi:chromosome partitioning protein
MLNLWRRKREEESPAQEESQTKPEESPRRHKVIAVVNQKGGVGKSTTAVNLSAYLAQAGFRVLLLDLDPQGNASSGLGINGSRVDQCIYNALIESKPARELVRSTPLERLFAIPASIQLAGAEIELVSALARENRLKTAIAEVRQEYDYVIIDCPPSLGLLTVNALVAAEQVLIPIQCEYYALEGLSKLLDSIRLVQKQLNPELGIAGVLMTMHDPRTKLSQQVVEEVSKYFSDKVYRTIIPRSVRLSEAPSYGQPISVYDASSKGAEAYQDLAKEVIARG